MPEPKSILVVEDEALMREVTVSVLEEAGFAVSAAVDGQQAIDRLQTGPMVDLILLDIMMPRVNGWGVLAYVDRMASRPQVVVTTGLAEAVPPGHLGHLVSGCLHKPFTGSQLLLTCESALAAEPVVGAGGARGEERRNFIVDVTLLSAAGQPVGTATLVQVSLGGFRLQLEARFQPGDLVRAAFRLPSCAETLVLSGRVAWQRDDMLGAVMHSLAPAHEECLRELIEA